MPEKILLSARALNKSFQLNKRRIPVLKDVEVDVRAGEFVAIMGRSGSGKSTLLSLLAGLDSPDSGQVMLGEAEISAMNEEQLARIRRERIGFVFQSFHLIPTLTVRENIRFPLQLAGQNDEKRIDDLLERTGLSERADSMPNQLSGGEKQRTAMARALVIQPDILFADEPTGNLDEDNAEQVMALLIDLQQRYHTALVIVTHDPDIAERADRLITLVNGEIA